MNRQRRWVGFGLVFWAQIACFGHSTALSKSPDRPSIQSIRFDTTAAPPPVRFQGPSLVLARAIRSAGRELKEKTVVRAVLALGAGQQGLTGTQTRSIWKHLEPIYRAIDSDPAFGPLGSALPFCFSNKRPDSGHAFVSLPAKVGPRTPWVVFLHGDGGNFLYYLHQMRRFFPEAVVVLPSHGIRWRGAKAAYVRDAIKHVAEMSGVPAGRPTLMALSGAGPAAFNWYAQHQDQWAGLISLASAPDRSLNRRFTATCRLLMINGTLDRRFPIRSVRLAARSLQRRKVNVQAEELEADHFLMLTHAESVRKLLRPFVLSRPD